MSRSFLDFPESQHFQNFWSHVDNFAYSGISDSANVLLVDRDRLLTNVKVILRRVVRQAVSDERFLIAGRLRRRRNRRFYGKKH